MSDQGTGPNLKETEMHKLLRRTVPVLVVLLFLAVPLGAVSGRGSLVQTQALATVTDAAWAATDDGATAEVLVLLRDQVDVAAVRRGVGRSSGPPNGELAAVDRRVVGRRIYGALQHRATTSQAALRAWLEARGVTYRSFYVVNALLVHADEALLRALARRSEVAQIMANPRVAMSLPPDQPVVAPFAMSSADVTPWGINKIGAPEVWALGYRGQGVVVAGQDTGYAWDHPALLNQYRGWDGVTATHDYHWHDAIHSGGGVCGADSPVPCDDNGHGTHTMGTIVGDDGVSQQIGVAPEARWMGCRNMSQGVGTPATYAECFEFFLAPYPVGATPVEGEPDLAPDVINNSWSCPPYEGCDAYNIAFLEQVVENVRAAGILVVASAGNRGPTCGTVDQPVGMYDASFSVGATDSTDTIAGFSSRGAGTGVGLIKPDISAPGVGVYSALPGGGYGYKSGTSMAAPHVVGAAALFWSVRPELRGAITETEHFLLGSAVPLTSTWCGDAPDAVPNSVYGWGRSDARRAVELALTGTLVGVVRDGQGSGIADAEVLAKRSDTYAVGTTSGGGGVYALKPLPGTYTVTVSHPDYPSQIHPGVVVSAGLTTTLNITLTRSYEWFFPLVLRAPSP